ncbi:ras-related protein Rab-4B-like [Planococcus citri]|uniref:ras-related protein Rab-4B-like n=1 Tax=Planococcus citri TaxID=170843 RepID=UPI0031F7C460
MSQEPYDILLKFLITGEESSGKSCLLDQFIEKKFEARYAFTITVNVGSKIVQTDWTDGKTTKLQIWDISGRQNFQVITGDYYKDSVGALLVFDITNRRTFDALWKWLDQARSLMNPHAVILLVGNKKDLENEREVSILEAEQYARENELIYLETSAKSGENVEEAFLLCCEQVVNKIKTGELKNTIRVPPSITKIPKKNHASVGLLNAKVNCQNNCEVSTDESLITFNEVGTQETRIKKIVCEVIKKEIASLYEKLSSLEKKIEDFYIIKARIDETDERL